MCLLELDLVHERLHIERGEVEVVPWDIACSWLRLLLGFDVNHVLLTGSLRNGKPKEDLKHPTFVKVVFEEITR